MIENAMLNGEVIRLDGAIRLAVELTRRELKIYVNVKKS